MGIKKQQKWHKKLRTYDERLDVIEGILSSTLLISAVIFITGLILTALIDPIRGRTFEMDWLQSIGLLVFGSLFGLSLVTWLTVSKK